MRKMFSQKQIEDIIPGKVQEEIDNGNILTMPIGEVKTMTLGIFANGDNTYVDTTTSVKAAIFDMNFGSYSFYLAEDIELTEGAQLQGHNQDSELYCSFSLYDLEPNISFPYTYSQLFENVEVYYSTDLSSQWEKFDDFVMDSGYTITIADPTFYDAQELYIKIKIKKGYYKCITA